MELFNKDFLDFITAFNDQGVDYILIGGMAVVIHGYPRTTGDMDLWVKKTKTNYKKIEKAFHQFGMPVFDMTLENFLSDSFDVWMFGVSPIKIELITNLKKLNFNTVLSHANKISYGTISVTYIDIENLIISKRNAGRPKDLDDILQLLKKGKN